jgi:hypothetical protein
MSNNGARCPTREANAVNAFMNPGRDVCAWAHCRDEARKLCHQGLAPDEVQSGVIGNWALCQADPSVAIDHAAPEMPVVRQYLNLRCFRLACDNPEASEARRKPSGFDFNPNNVPARCPRLFFNPGNLVSGTEEISEFLKVPHVDRRQNYGYRIAENTPICHQEPSPISRMFGHGYERVFIKRQSSVALGLGAHLNTTAMQNAADSDVADTERLAQRNGAFAAGVARRNLILLLWRELPHRSIRPIIPDLVDRYGHASERLSRRRVLDPVAVRQKHRNIVAAATQNESGDASNLRQCRALRDPLSLPMAKARGISRRFR